jgi:membrane protease YdiL (CAAX protease family)
MTLIRSSRILLFFALLVSPRFFPDFLKRYDPFLISMSLLWICVLFILVFLKIDRGNLEAIGLRYKNFISEILTGMGIFLVVIVYFFIFSYLSNIIFPKSRIAALASLINPLPKIPHIFDKGNIYYFWGLITAGICEEMLFRGYFYYEINRLVSPPDNNRKDIYGVKNKYLSIPIYLLFSSFGFALLHIGNWEKILIALSGGLTVSIIYLFRKKLIALMVMHILFNLVYG